MKHTLKITSLLVFLFLLTQLVGLKIISNYITVKEVVKEETFIEDGKVMVKKVVVKEEVFDELPYGIERPDMKEKTSYLQIIFAMVVATVLALILLKFQAMRLWKLWFFLSVFFTLLIAFNAFVNQAFALILALIFASFKTFKNNVVIHNFSWLLKKRFLMSFLMALKGQT